MPSSIDVLDTRGQMDAVTMLFARMACRVPEQPCDTCLKFCMEAITERAFPIIRDALAKVAETGRVESGFGEIMLGSALSGPLTAPREEEGG